MTCLKLSDAEARLCHQSNDGDLLERFDRNDHSSQKTGLQGYRRINRFFDRIIWFRIKS